MADKRPPLTHDRQAQTAKPEDKPYHRNALEGLYLVIEPDGRKWWLYRKQIKGKRIFISMGAYPAVSLADAKLKRDEANRLAAKGINPSEHRKNERVEAAIAKTTLNDVIKEYLQKEAPKLKSRKEVFTRLNWLQREWPELCAKPVEALHQKDFIALREARELTVKPGTVIREIGLISSVLTFAVREMHVLEKSPIKEIKKPPQPPHRERRVKQEDIDRILQASKYDPANRPRTKTQQSVWAMLFGIETGMRSSEICTMTWENVHPSYVHLTDTKNNSTRNVPLTERACELLEVVKGLDEVRVLTVKTGSRDKLFRDVKKKAGYEKGDLNFHDSRHEATSRLAKIIANPATLAKITGHKDLKRIMTYYNPTAEELAEELAKGSAAEKAKKAT